MNSASLNCSTSSVSPNCWAAAARRWAAIHARTIRRRLDAVGRVGEGERRIEDSLGRGPTDPLAQVRVGLPDRPLDVGGLVVEEALVAVEVDDLDESELDTFVDVTVHRVAIARELLAVGEALVVLHSRQVRALHAVGRDRPGEVGVRVVARVGITEVLHQRRVGRHHVVRLHERFLAGLPVDTHDLLDVSHLHPLLERVLGEVLVEPGEVFTQRCGVAIGIDEHEAVPRVDERLGERGVGGAHAREVPLAGDLLQRSVEVPRPAVECAPQVLRALAVGLAQQAAAVQAGVAVGLDAIGGAHDEERQVGDLVHVIVADLGDLLLETGQLPDATPQLLDLERMELG